MTQAIDAEDEITIPQQLVRQELLEHQHQQLGNSMGPPQTVPAGEPLQVRIANGQEDGHHDMETDPGADVVPSRPLSRSGNINDGSSTTISHEPEVAPPHSASLLLQPSLPYLPDHSPTNNENSQNSTQKNTHVEPRVTPAAVTSTPALPSSPSSPSTLTSYSVGMYLEVQDKVQKWCEAEVIGINTSLKTLRITYLYWGDKYDEDIPFFSSRLAPFPTHTYQPGQPHTLQVGQRIEVEDLEKEVGKRWGEAEVKALEEKDEKREGGRLGMVLVSWKRPKEKERVEQWLPMDSSRLRAYGRMKTSTLEKKRLNRAAAAAAAVAATRTRAATTGATATGGSKRMPLRAIDDTNHHQLNVRKNKTCINLSEPHLRSIAASSDRYSAYEQGLRRQGLAIQPIEGDGNCLFRSVSHQVYGTEEHHLLIRGKCMDYMDIEREYFEPYVVGGMEEYLQYLQLKRQGGVWGDDPEVQALCEMYDRPAEIWSFDAVEGAKKLRTFHEAAAGAMVGVGRQGGGRTVVAMRLSYYGGGHYDSLMTMEGREGGSVRMPPGVMEDRALEMARQRRAAVGGRGLGAVEEMKRRSDEEATERAAVEAALRVSREDFGSLADLETALEVSAETHLQQELLRSAAATTEEDMIRKALEDSLNEGGREGEWVGGTEEEMVKAALEQSLAGREGEEEGREEDVVAAAARLAEEEYQQALNLSMVEAKGGEMEGGMGEDGEVAAAIALSLQQPPFLSSVAGAGTSNSDISQSSGGVGEAYLREQQRNLEEARARKEAEDLRRALEVSIQPLTSSREAGGGGREGGREGGRGGGGGGGAEGGGGGGAGAGAGAGDN